MASGIADIYNPSNEGALQGARLFTQLFEAEPADLLLSHEVPLKRLMVRLVREAESQDPEELTEYLMTLVDEYRHRLTRVRTESFAYNIPDYVGRLREQLLRPDGALLRRNSIPVELAVVVAEVMHLAREEEARAEAELAASAKVPAAAARTEEAGAAPAPAAAPAPSSVEFLIAQRKAARQQLKEALAPVLVPTPAKLSATGDMKWHGVKSLDNVRTYLTGLGFVALGNYQETITRHGKPLVTDNHHYFYHAASGLLASADAVVGQPPQVSFYAAFADANATPTCFAEFTDAVKATLRHNDTKHRVLITRLHTLHQQVADPAQLVHQLEKANSGNVFLHFGGLPLAPLGLDKNGVLTWLPNQLARPFPNAVPPQLAKAMLELPEGVTISDVTLMERDKQAPKITRFISEHAETPISAERKAPLLTGQGRAREDIAIDEITDERVLAFATRWNDGVESGTLAAELKIKLPHLYNLVKGLRDDPTYVPVQFRAEGEAQVRKATRPLIPAALIEDITDDQCRAFAADWNNLRRTTSELLTQYNVIYKTLLSRSQLLQEEPTIGWQQLTVRRAAAEPKEKVAGISGRARARIAQDIVDKITDEKCKALVVAWNDTSVTRDALTETQEASYNTVVKRVKRIATAPGLSWDMVADRRAGRRAAADKVERSSSGKKGAQRFKISAEVLAKITDARCKALAEKWNDDSLTATTLESSTGINYIGLRRRILRINEGPELPWESINDRRAKESGGGASAAALSKRRLLEDEIIEKIADPSCKKLAEAWNRGDSFEKLNKDFSIGQGRIVGVINSLRKDPTFVWAKRQTAATRSAERYADFGRAKPASTPGAKASHVNMTAGDIAEFRNRKQKTSTAFRDAMKGVMTFDVSYGSPASLKADFDDLSSAEPALHSLGFRMTSEKEEDGLDRYYQHPSGIRLRMVVDDEENINYTLALGFCENGAAPAGYTELRAIAGYTGTLPLDGDDKTTRRVTMYLNKTPHNQLGQRLIEIQTAVNSGLFALLPYAKVATAVGKMTLMPRPVPTPVVGQESLESQLRSNGIVLNKAAIKSSADFIPQSAVKKPTPKEVNIIIAGVTGEQRFELVSHLKGEGKSRYAGLVAMAAAQFGGTLPAINVHPIRTIEGENPYDVAAITDKMQEGATNILCIGVRRGLEPFALGITAALQEADSRTLTLALETGLTPTERGDLLRQGMDDVERADADPVVVQMRLLALARRDRNQGANVEAFGPLLVEWSGTDQNRILQNFTASYEGRSCHIHLTGKEAGLLECLLKRPEGMTKEGMLGYLYQDKPDVDWPELKIIDVFVCKLRKKIASGLDAVGYPVTISEPFIDTVWGHGYITNPNFGANVVKVQDASRPADEVIGGAGAGAAANTKAALG